MQTYETLVTQMYPTGILHVSLNRPSKLNALNQKVLTELSDIFLNLDGVKGVLLSGEGKAFCAGADISELQTLTSEDGVVFAEKGQQVFAMLENAGIPSVAVVNGFAFGGGCELALSASIRIASEQAKFGQPEVKLGVIPGFGGTQRLARLVGKGRALDLCLTGRTIDANTALAWGLVTEVYSAEKCLVQGQAILESMLELGPLALKGVLECIHGGYDLPLTEALRLERTWFGICCGSPQKQEGVQAFLEKRKPDFDV